MSQPTIFRGVVRGNGVVFTDPVGLPEGQEVVVSVEVAPRADATRLEKLRRAIGSWKHEGEELDRFLDWTREQRKVDGQRDPS